MTAAYLLHFMSNHDIHTSQEDLLRGRNLVFQPMFDILAPRA